MESWTRLCLARTVAVSDGTVVRRARLSPLAALVLLAPGLLVLLAGCGRDGANAATPATPLSVGDVLPQPLAITTLADPETPEPIDLGSKATVFYAWSVPCPCVESAEHRLRKLMKRYDGRKGVAWFAVAGEPKDTMVGIREKKLRLGSPYPIVLDPTQRLCTILGLDAACQVAVLDGDGRLVYGGALDADYVEGKGEYLAEALDAVLAGRAVTVSHREHTYGCAFDDPASCVQTRE